MNVNKVLLVGRLTRDPELKTLPSGQSVTSFGLATSKGYPPTQSITSCQGDILRVAE